MRRACAGTLLALACGLLGVAPARAEVRAVVGPQGRAATLELRAVGGGIWTARTPVRLGVINPAGDRFADGLPGFVGGVEESLVAWSRGADGSVHVARVVHVSGDVAETAVGASAVGTPAPVRLPDAWIVAFQEVQAADAWVSVAIVPDSTNGLDELVPVAVTDGILLGAVATGDRFQVVTTSRDATRITVITIGLIMEPHPEPIPISLTVLGTTVFLVMEPSPHPIPISPMGSGTVVVAATSGHPEPIPTCLTGDGVMATLRWRAANGWVGEVQLDESGPVGEPDYRHGSLGSCR